MWPIYSRIRDNPVGERDLEPSMYNYKMSCRAVARGRAGWAMAHPVFWRFVSKICKMLHLRHFLCCLAHPVSKCLCITWVALEYQIDGANIFS